MIRCNSDTDSKVWMKEDVFYLRSFCVDSRHLEGIALSGVIYFQGVFFMKTNRISVRALVVTSMLSAVAFVLMFLEFPIPIMPPFIKLDISDLPPLLASFALGPIYGVVAELLKNLLHILIQGSSTAYVGELFNFLCGSFMCFFAGLIYRHKRSRSGALIASLVGCAVMALGSVPLNYFIVYPAYEVFYHLPMDVIIKMYQVILPSVDGLLECLMVFNLPFTFCKGLIDVLICFLIYKPLSPILHGSH